MTNEEKKRIALEVIGEALFRLDDELGAKVDHDRTIIVAALLEHAGGDRRHGVGTGEGEADCPRDC
jgi:hypothetical protein